jgi:hypothetical protein
VGARDGLQHFLFFWGRSLNPSLELRMNRFYCIIAGAVLAAPQTECGKDEK